MARLQSIHVAKGSRLPMRAVDTAEVEAGKGIVGDRYHGTRHRHVTVQSAESLAEAARGYGAVVPPELTRRNLTVDLGEVPRQPGARITAARCCSRWSGSPPPCKLLDDTIGRGAQEALRRRAGSVCRVLTGGTITVGDEVEL
jgi:MOSC domain-containing protein YiiM